MKSVNYPSGQYYHDMKGVYVLIFELGDDTGIRVGKLGKLHFKTGYYAYTGSARGSGGFKRVNRHFNVASGINSTRKWHIDHLLPYIDLRCAVLLQTDDDIECKVAGKLAEFSEIIYGFGCSDCSCSSHLFYSNRDFMNKIIDSCNKLTGNESIIINPHI